MPAPSCVRRRSAERSVRIGRGLSERQHQILRVVRAGAGKVSHADLLRSCFGEHHVPPEAHAPEALRVLVADLVHRNGLVAVLDQLAATAAWHAHAHRAHAQAEGWHRAHSALAWARYQLANEAEK
jgi:hypothetical protein